MATSTRSEALIQQENQFGAHNYHPLDVVCTKGEGVYLSDVDGKRYMDFLAAYSAVNQGHNHPRIAEALIAQAKTLALTCRAFRNDQFPPLLEKLCKLTGFDKALLMNSGAEAVETAIKAIAQVGLRREGHPVPQGRDHRGRGQLPRPHHHDRRLLAPTPTRTSRFGPFTPGFRIVPYGDLEAVRRPRSRQRPAPSSSSRSRARAA